MSATHIIGILVAFSVKATSNRFTIELAPQPPIFAQAAELLDFVFIQYPFQKYHDILFPCCDLELQKVFPLSGRND